jgi:hypothetical protein
MFKSIQAATASIGSPQPSIDDAGIKRVFMVLHGFYGNLFLSKFATGSVENGEDQGIANARKVWAYSLRDFDAETIKGALRRCQAAHVEFPPSLPQFLSLCAAIKPREAFKPAALPALAMSQELIDERMRKHRQNAADLAQSLKETAGGGLDLLKQAIARAFADAGGDEATELLRLDRMLAPQARAA